MSSILFSYYLCQSLKRYGVFFTEKQIRLLSFSLLCLGGFLLAQKTVSGSNLFPVPASSEAGFSAPAPKLPHTGKQTEKRISASARAAVDTPDIRGRSESVHPCTFFNDDIRGGISLDESSRSYTLDSLSLSNDKYT